MPESTVKLLGLNRFRATLRKAGVDMADLKEANVAVSRTVSSRAQAIGPQRTGKLMGSLRNPRQASKAVVRSNLIYAPVIHYGWPGHHIRRQPFLLIASGETREEWQGIYEKALQDLLDHVEGA